ncbi:MAG TPA: hypothetical protein VJQ54_19430 [Candidatus Sulfotelmatobacter sp.]|nr:hypothetical protein [Candidatus Sulfotelmatobacter sp.]
MREETQKPVVICVHCKLPIMQEQRPSVQFNDGSEVHVECYNEYNDQGRRNAD